MMGAEKTGLEPIESFKDLMSRIGLLSEQQLQIIINYESVTYKRKDVLTRLHMRYCKLRNARERDALLRGEYLI